MIRYHQQLEKALLYFQWVYIHIAFCECTLPCISVLEQVVRIYLQELIGKKKKNPRTTFSHFAHFLHYFSSQGFQVYSSSGLCS